MLTRWNRLSTPSFNRTPFSLFGELQQNLGRMLEDWDRDMSLFQGGAQGRGWGGLNVDLFDQGENFLFRVEVPGFSESDIKLSVNAEFLSISGERKLEVPEGHTQHRRERSSYKFSRSFAFPTKVDVEKVSAQLKDGILQIEVAKAPEIQPRQIEVKIA